MYKEKSKSIVQDGPSETFVYPNFDVHFDFVDGVANYNVNI